jgi:hypothetical protein
MVELHLGRHDVESSLDRLEQARHIRLLPGTHRILMAFPFSAIASPFRVRVRDRGTYFANCAWDSIAFFPMLHQPLRVESFCHHCAGPISFEIREGRPVSDASDLPVVYLGRPAAEWWQDIITTCSNTMLFFANPEHLRSWRADYREENGVELSIETVLRLSEALYAGRLERDFARPSRDRLVELFRGLKLTGAFWQI